MKCLTLFVTHYPLLGELETKYPGAVGNFHMAYVEAEGSSKLELDTRGSHLCVPCRSICNQIKMKSSNHCADQWIKMKSSNHCADQEINEIKQSMR